MTAIAGRIDLVTERPAAPERAAEARAVVEKMLATMKRRGPDGERSYDFARGCLGVAWLHVTTEDRSDHAPHDPGQMTIVADARIDNPEHIVAACGGSPDDPPTELIRRAYQRWGEDCAAELRGDFAFAVWDPARRRLFCARDHMGVRLLYYAFRNGVLLLATQPSALLCDPMVRREPDDFAIARHIYGDYNENGETLYRDVNALAAAHTLIADERGPRVARYWHPDPHRRLPRMSDEDYAALFRQALGRAVRRRMRLRGRPAVHMSGGMDSTSVAAEIEHQRRLGSGPDEPPLLVHLTFPGMPCDERTYSRAVASHCGLPLVEIDALSRPELTSPSCSARIPDMPYHPCMTIWFATLEAARAEGVRVMAGGEGGDLCMDMPCMTMPSIDAADALTRGELRRMARLVFTDRPITKIATWRRAYDLTLRQLIPWRLRRALLPLLPPRRTPFLYPRWNRPIRERVVAERAALERRGVPDLATRFYLSAIENGTQHRALVTIDRVASAHGIQFIHPLLDVELIELTLAMPVEQRHVPAMLKPKPVVRRAMRGTLPARLLRRADAAEFSCYVNATAFGRHEPELREILRGRRLRERGIADTTAAASAIGKTSDLPTRRSILNIAAMELWLRHLSRT